MISFAAYDIDKRVSALREGLDRPMATIVRIAGNECARCALPVILRGIMLDRALQNGPTARLVVDKLRALPLG